MSTQPDPTLSAPRPQRTALLVAYFAVLLVVLVAALYALVTTPSAPGGTRPGELVLSHGTLLLAVVLTGALGSYVHTSASLAWARGSRTGEGGSGSTGYVLSPFVGAAVAVVFYLAARGILLALSTGDPAVDPYGILALAALAGMLSRPVSDRVARALDTAPIVEPEVAGGGAWQAPSLGLAAFAPASGGAETGVAAPDAGFGTGIRNAFAGAGSGVREEADPVSRVWMGERLFSPEKDEDEEPVSPEGEG